MTGKLQALASRGLSLGATSRANLKGVHPALVRVVERAIQLTTQDFAVHCGARSRADQRRYVAGGTSWTMKSKHLRQADDFAHAVDLVPFIAGELRWDWEGCFAVAAAMSRAAFELEIQLRWGGVWDRSMDDYGRSNLNIRDASSAYVGRRRKLGKRAALDGPHFELLKAK